MTQPNYCSWTKDIQHNIKTCKVILGHLIYKRNVKKLKENNNKRICSHLETGLQFARGHIKIGLWRNGERSCGIS